MLLKRIASISTLTLLLATGAANAKTPGISSIASRTDAFSLSKVVPGDDANNNSPDGTPVGGTSPWRGAPDKEDSKLIGLPKPPIVGTE